MVVRRRRRSRTDGWGGGGAGLLGDAVRQLAAGALHNLLAQDAVFGLHRALQEAPLVRELRDVWNRCAPLPSPPNPLSTVPQCAGPSDSAFLGTCLHMCAYVCVFLGVECVCACTHVCETGSVHFAGGLAYKASTCRTRRMQTHSDHGGFQTPWLLADDSCLAPLIKKRCARPYLILA